MTWQIIPLREWMSLVTTYRGNTCRASTEDSKRFIFFRFFFICASVGVPAEDSVLNLALEELFELLFLHGVTTLPCAMRQLPPSASRHATPELCIVLGLETVPREVAQRREFWEQNEDSGNVLVFGTETVISKSEKHQNEISRDLQAGIENPSQGSSTWRPVDMTRTGEDHSREASRSPMLCTPRRCFNNLP